MKHILVLTLLFNLYTFQETNKLESLIKSTCVYQHAIDISNGTFNPHAKTILHGNTMYTADEYFTHENKLMGCNCDLSTCVSKCCLEEAGSTECDYGHSPHVKVDLYHENMTISKEHGAHESVYWNAYCNTTELEEDFFILTDGRLYSSEMDHVYGWNEYCVSNDGNETHDKIVALVCVDEEDLESFNRFNKFGMMISIPFLFVTLAIYCFLPDKKIQIKCLMAYITCLMLSYIFLVYLQFNPNLNKPECEIIAAFGVYFFMSTFCWMNITCIDMYLTFSGKRAPLQSRSSSWKRFGFYLLFANGVPVILLSVIFGVNNKDDFLGHPKFGINYCWIDDGFPQLLYFYGPMALLLTINTVLFIITAHTIRNTMRDNKKMLRNKESQRHCDSNKQDYVLYIKLFVAMGINWSMEFISWFIEWSVGRKEVPWVFYPTDFCNAIYGIFIFITFVCKKAVWIKLKHRYYILIGQSYMARGMSTLGMSGYQLSHTEKISMDESCATNMNSKINMNQM